MSPEKGKKVSNRPANSRGCLEATSLSTFLTDRSNKGIIELEKGTDMITITDSHQREQNIVVNY